MQKAEQKAEIQQFMQVDNQQLKERQFLRDKQAAAWLGIGCSTVWMYVRQGKLKAIKLSPKVTVFAISDLQEFVQSRMNIA